MGFSGCIEEWSFRDTSSSRDNSSKPKDGETQIGTTSYSVYYVIFKNTFIVEYTYTKYVHNYETN
jgi:hypothetical protein